MDFVSLSGDITVIVEQSGVIRNVAQGEGDPLAPLAYEWVGRR
ncbi:hypothetical protein [Variovorax sp. GT1P44]